MRTRVRLHTDKLVTIHTEPSWLGLLLGERGADYPVMRITELTGKHTWVTTDNRPVTAEVAEAIEAELTRACVGGRLAELMTRQESK